MVNLQEAYTKWRDQLEYKLLEATPEGHLHTMAKHHISSGGKRLRALLPVWLCHNLGGDAADALPIEMRPPLFFDARQE